MRMSMRKPALFALILVLMIGALTAGPALAAKGSGHKTQPTPTHAPTGSATLVATPNPAVVGQQVWLSGCGYLFEPAQERITQPDGTVLTYSVGVWSTGCLDNSYFVPKQQGNYTVQIFQKSGKTTSQMASTVVTVS